MNNNVFFIDYEQRQHINLSKRANEIIELDMIRFNDDYELKNKSGFINTIIENYYDTFALSEKVVFKQINTIRKAIKTDNVSDRVTKQIIDVFTNEMMKNAIAEYAKKYEYSVPFKLKLNKKNVNLLVTVSSAVYFNEFAPRSALGFYIKAIVEDYATLSSEARERIYHRKLIEQIERSLKDSSLFSFREKTNAHLWKVVGLNMSESGAGLIVHFIKVQEKEEYVTFHNISLKDFARFSPTLIENEEINENYLEYVEHHQKFTQQTKDKTFDFFITFSDDGHWKYLYEEQTMSIIGIPVKDKPRTYKFNASEASLFNHFFKYGIFIENIEPLKTFNRFKLLHKAAYEKYDKKING